MSDSIQSTAINRSDDVLDTTSIERLISLYEDPEAWVEYFIEKCCKVGTPEGVKENIRKNFPYSDDFRSTIKRMACSIPGFRWAVRKGLQDDAAEDGTEKPEGDEGEQSLEEQLINAANDMSALRIWEGDKSLWAANGNWREFVLLTGDTFIKLPYISAVKTCLPERMASQDSRIKSSPGSRKGIAGYMFQYRLGDEEGGYSQGGLKTDMVVEVVTAEKWTVQEPGEVEKEIALSYGFIPVSHFGWEEREGNPRGLPLGLRLAKKCLHLSMVQFGIRMGSKLNSFPVGVFKNVKTGIQELYPGIMLELDDISPQLQASFKFEGGNLNLSSLENELDGAKRDLAKLAFLPFEGKEGAQNAQPASGRAMERLTAAQVAYRVNFLLAEASFLEDLAYKFMVVSKNPLGKGMKRGDLTPIYDGFDEDQTGTLERAKLLFQEGFIEDALRLLGYEEEAIERMVVEAKQNKLDNLSAMFMGSGDVAKIKQPIEDPNKPPTEPAK